MAIAGTGMGAFARLLQEAGYEVRGSDEKVWPPMSDLLRAAGIRWMEGFRPENLEPAPDLVIVGNVIRRVNPEATAMRDRHLPHLSFPEALGALFLEGRHSVVVAGTHGKTTTSTLTAWLLHHAGRDPLVPGGRGGAEPRRLGASRRRPPLRGRGRRVRHRLLLQGPQAPPRLSADERHPHRPRSSSTTRTSTGTSPTTSPPSSASWPSCPRTDSSPPGPGASGCWRWRAAARARWRPTRPGTASTPTGPPATSSSAPTAPASSWSTGAGRWAPCTSRSAAGTTWRTRWAPRRWRRTWASPPRRLPPGWPPSRGCAGARRSGASPGASR